MSGSEPRLQTERLSLRPLSAADVDALVALDADPAVRRFVDQPEAPSREDVLGRLPRLLRRYGDADEPAFWAAEDRQSGGFCGWFHLRPLEDDPACLDLGYRLRRERWGRGLATEGARALVERAFGVLGAERVVAHALEANRGSRRVLEKLGLQEHARYLHRGALPAVAYALGREEHLRTQAGPAAAERPYSRPGPSERATGARPGEAGAAAILRNTDAMHFRSVVLLGGKTATGIEVPAHVVEALGAGKRPPVRVTIRGHTYRSTVASMGGRSMLPLSAENRGRAGVAAGDEIEVEIELDGDPREVSVPPDFAEALDRDAAARQRFDRLSFSHKQRHVLAIEGAKSAETRQRRIDKAIEVLREE